MNTLTDSLPRTLAAIDRARPFALLLRHAEREEVPAHDPYADVDLTARGVAAATALADELRGSLCWAASSPFRRCRRTAHTLLGGEAARIADDTRLGAHGPWVLDQEEGARIFESLGNEGVVRAQIAGVRWPCIRAPDDGVRVLLASALERLDTLGSGLCVSHDAVLMPAIAHLTGERFEGRWLAPLDGIAMQRDGGRCFAFWCGRRFEVPPC